MTNTEKKTTQTNTNLDKVEKRCLSEMVANRPIYPPSREKDGEDVQKSPAQKNKKRSKFSEKWERWRGLGLSQNRPAELYLDLDRHYAALSVLSHQYQKHYFSLKTSQNHDVLRDTVKEGMESAKRHNQKLGERMAELGVVPTSAPRSQAKLSYITHEPEGRHTWLQMLKRDLRHEETIYSRLKKTAGKAFRSGDTQTANLLSLITKETEKRISALEELKQSALFKGGFEKLLQFN